MKFTKGDFEYGDDEVIIEATIVSVKEICEFALFDELEDIFESKVKKGELACFIERMDVDEDVRGQGIGSKNLLRLISDLKDNGITKIFLFASYDLNEDDEEYDENGLEKILKFYKKNGFNQLFSMDSNSDQIDMSIG